MTVFFAPIPLLTAIAATLTFAGAWVYVTRSMGADISTSASYIAINLYANGFAAAGVAAGAGIITAVIGGTQAFYCAPAIPWRIDIALFGSFIIALLATLARPRGILKLTYPLSLLTLLWIAPYYGYFSGAIFLGISLINQCADRSAVQLVLVAAGMVTGNVLGILFALWLSKSSNHNDLQI